MIIIKKKHCRIRRYIYKLSPRLGSSPSCSRDRPRNALAPAPRRLRDTADVNHGVQLFLLLFFFLTIRILLKNLNVKNNSSANQSAPTNECPDAHFT